MKHCIIIFLIAGIGFANQSFAQLENKLFAHGYIGLPIYNKQSNENQSISGQNIFSDYKSIPMIGGGIYYGFNTKLAIGINGRFNYTNKDNYTLPAFGLGLETKYNFVHNDKPISPFVIAEINTNAIAINQTSFTENVNLSPTGNTEDVEPTLSTTFYPEQQIKLNNVLGYMIGAGVDFTVKKKLGMYFSVNYMTTNADQQAAVSELYPDNNSTYSFITLKVGIKIGFLQSNDL